MLRFIKFINEKDQIYKQVLWVYMTIHTIAIPICFTGEGFSFLRQGSTSEVLLHVFQN